MDIGSKIKQRRIKLGLTQEELASRSELSKGFISQLERDLTSPSITTLVDILECLGTNLKDFFNEALEEKIVFGPKDIFIKENPEQKNSIQWLIPNSQKNALEPILMTLQPDGSSDDDDPHEGEEFGYVLCGNVTLELGTLKYKLKKGDSFCFEPSVPHRIVNNGKRSAEILWVSTPPTF